MCGPQYVIQCVALVKIVTCLAQQTIWVDMAGLEQNFKNGSRAVAARDWWGCCNSSQQRFYNSTAARIVMTCDISFLRSNCETSVYCFVADLLWGECPVWHWYLKVISTHLPSVGQTFWPKGRIHDCHWRAGFSAIYAIFAKIGW